MNDPIVDEVRAVRDAHAARFNYDLEAIFRDIQEQQRKLDSQSTTINTLQNQVNILIQQVQELQNH